MGIYYVEIDENWDPINPPGSGLTVVYENLHDSMFPGNNYWYYARRTGLKSVWTDGSAVVSAYYNNDVCAYYSPPHQLMDVLRIEKDGTITVLHDGSYDGYYNQPHTDGASTAIVDLARQFGTTPDETNPAIYIGGAYSQYADSVWHDTDADENYDEMANAVRCGSSNYDHDTELVGDTMILHTYNKIEKITFDDTGNTYDVNKEFFVEANSTYDINNYEGMIAVGDTTGDGVLNVYWLDSADDLLMGSDLDDNGVIDDSEIVELESEAFNGIPGDLELYRTDNGSWVLMHMTSYISWWAGKRIEIWSVLDNGDINNSDYKRVIQWHARTGSGDNSLAAVKFCYYPDIEFAPIPEPATLLLLGTGALGAIGAIRRRRVK